MLSRRDLQPDEGLHGRRDVRQPDVHPGGQHVRLRPAALLQRPAVHRRGLRVHSAGSELRVGSDRLLQRAELHERHLHGLRWVRRDGRALHAIGPALLLRRLLRERLRDALSG